MRVNKGGPSAERRRETKPQGPRRAVAALLGRGSSRGCAALLEQRDFSGTPVNLPRVPRRTFFPDLPKFIAFAAAPFVLTPFVRNQVASQCLAPHPAQQHVATDDQASSGRSMLLPISITKINYPY